MKKELLKKSSVLVIACICLLGAGCSKRITEGEVYYKTYEPERTWVQIIPIIMSNGKTTTTTMIPMVHFDDEDWIIDIRKWSEEKQKWKTRRFYVSQNTYNSINEGDWFLFDKNLCETSDHVEKHRE